MSIGYSNTLISLFTCSLIGCFKGNANNPLRIGSTPPSASKRSGAKKASCKGRGPSCIELKFLSNRSKVGLISVWPKRKAAVAKAFETLGFT